MDVIITGATGPAGLNGKARNDGSPGGPGGAAMAINSASSDSSNRALAYGGLGGMGGAGGSADPGYRPGNGGDGGTGGAAYATVATAADTSSPAYAYAYAVGGTGGAGGAGGFGIPFNGRSGFGGAGGGAVAASVSHNAGSGSSKAISLALGGQYGPYGNTGGTAAATAQAISAGAGAPAYAYVEADAGAHQSVVLANAVTGATNDGALHLKQTANGGPSSHFGSAGDASSTLTFDDTASVTRSHSVKGVVQASGGAGGGGAVASLTLTGANAVNATAKAHGGQGGTIAGYAKAKTKATGLSGAFKAEADTSLAVGQLVTGASAKTAGSVDGTSRAKAQVAIGEAALTFDSHSQAVALESAAPGAASTAAVLAANANINSAFGASPIFFALDEVGGSYAKSGGTGPQTTTETVNLTVDLTKLASRQDLLVGFYGGTALGTNVTGVTFDLIVDGVDVLSKTFASGALAQTYFTDNSADLGSLASGSPLVGTNTILTVKAVLTVTSTAAGSGFYGQMIVGDPPPAASASRQFIQAMAGLGASSQGSTRPLSAGVSPNPPMLAMCRMPAVA